MRSVAGGVRKHLRGARSGTASYAGGLPVVLVVECVGSGVMNMTEKNGQPSMEEILASIRRIIAEEPESHPYSGELRGTPIMLKGDTVLEDASDFDLPAIFRASPPVAVERPAPLLGRLTDAIRSAATTQAETDAEELRNAKPVKPGVGAVNGSSAGLSSLASARNGNAHEPSSPAPLGSRAADHGHASTSNAAAAVPSATSAAEPKRVMAPFKDTHFMRMSPAPAELPASPAPVAVEVAAQPTQPVREESLKDLIAAPIRTDRSAFMESVAEIAPPHMDATPPPPLLSVEEHGTAEAAALAAMSPERTNPEAAENIDDATADLLRPMLRQWLADNMPRMVEKALHIEIAETLKGPKKA